MAARSRLQLDERRDQLLRLGLELFGRESYDAVSIDEIASRAGISKGLLYHYFPNKRAFYVEALRIAARELVKSTEPPPDLAGPLRAQAGLGAYLDYVEAHRDAYVTLMRGGIGSDPEIGEVIQSTRNEITERILTSLGLEEERPIFRNAFRAYIGAVEAASLDWLERGDVSRDDLMAIGLSLLLATVSTAIQLDPEAGVRIEDLLA